MQTEPRQRRIAKTLLVTERHWRKNWRRKVSSLSPIEASFRPYNERTRKPWRHRLRKSTFTADLWDGCISLRYTNLRFSIKKGSSNVAADYLSRIYQGEKRKKAKNKGDLAAMLSGEDNHFKCYSLSWKRVFNMFWRFSRVVKLSVKRQVKGLLYAVNFVPMP